MDNFNYGLFVALLGGTALLSVFFYCIAGNVHKYFHGIGLVKGYTKLNLNMNYVCTIKFSETVLNISPFSS